MKNLITVSTEINAGITKVWHYFSKPEHIIKWNFAHEFWACPKAENDLKPGGKFNYRMEAKDGSFGFDFAGIYDNVEQNQRIDYTLGDNRKVNIVFEGNDNSTKITETFEAEEQNPLEMQQQGWQAILDNFKKYAEEN